MEVLLRYDFGVIGFVVVYRRSLSHIYATERIEHYFAMRCAAQPQRKGPPKQQCLGAQHNTPKNFQEHVVKERLKTLYIERSVFSTLQSKPTPDRPGRVAAREEVVPGKNVRVDGTTDT